MYGYLLISLCHVPASERLICVILSGREIKEELDTLSILNKAISKYVLYEEICSNMGDNSKFQQLLSVNNIPFESEDIFYLEIKK